MMLTANFAGRDIQYREQVENTNGRLLAFVYPNRLLTPQFYVYKGGNIPDTRGILGGKYVANCGRTPLTEELQNLIFYSNVNLAPEIGMTEAIKQWVYLLGYKLAFVNDAGAETRKVPLAGLNMNADWPQANQITFPGVIELVEDKTYTILGKTNQVPFYTINGQHPHLGDFTPEAYPYRWKRPVIIKWPQLNNGVSGSEPFDQFKARLRWPTLSNGTEVGFIDRRLIRILAPGEALPSPFTKDWGS